MADAADQAAVMLDDVDENQMTVTSEIAEPLMAVAEENVMEGETVNEDILQQAFEVASQSFDQTVAYTTVDGITVNVADGSIITEGEAQTVGNILTADDGTTYTYVSVPDSETLDSMHAEDPTQSVCHIETSDMLETDIPEPEADHQDEKHVNIDDENSSNAVYASMEEQQMPEQVCQPTVSVVRPAPSLSAPLGSSLNPIRIIQQGSQYTSVQQLTTEQLEQIMQVVQQQQLAKSTQEGGGSSVLYNSETQTRIVYRVIYPSELHAKNAGANTNVVTSQGLVRVAVPSQSVMIHHSKRPYRKRRQENDDRVETPELSKEEKDARKKHRPRTRSGRVSRPPKHMVQDYKHIHPVDWDEDYDDSDGGYSDFKLSDEEDREKDKKDSNYAAYTPLSSGKPKNWKCEKCEKAYIGRAGLARHYRMKPSHGKLGIDDTDDAPTTPTNGVDGDCSDSNSTQDSVCVSSGAATVVPSSSAVTIASATTTAATTTAATTTTTSSSSATTMTQPPKGALKMKQLYQQENTPSKRKNRLKEFVKQCDDEELMEIVLPRLAKVITLWEFLLMKVEKGRPPKLHLADMYREFEALHKQVKKMCDIQMKLVDRDGAQSETANPNQLQVTNEAIAQSLGLKVGMYDIQDRPLKEEPTFQYKFLTSDPANLYANPSQNAKRTVQIVAQSQIVAEARPSKRLKLDSTVAVASSPSDRDVSVPNNIIDDKVGEGVDTSLPPHLQGDSTTPIVVAIETPQQTDVNGDARSEEEEPLPPDNPESLIDTDRRSPSVVQSETTVCAADQVTTNGQTDADQLEYIDPSQQYVVQLASPEDLVGAHTDEQSMEVGEDPSGETQYIEGTLANGQLLQTDESGDTTQVLIEGGVAQLMGGEQFVDAAQVFQTEDGLLVIQAADGTLQIHGQNGQAIPMETVQALLGIDLEGAVEQVDTEQVEQMQ